MYVQVQYFDMPRKAGVRIESPDTLGRKCWAMALLAARSSDLAGAQQRLASAGLNISAFATRYTQTAPQTMDLCERVMANCFVNASYDPSRNGSCPRPIAEFRYLGFERENAKRALPLSYPFY